MSPIGLVDYGMGNLHSVRRGFERLGAVVEVVQRPEQLDPCRALVLPGVGAFDPAMERLRASGLVPALLDWCAAGRPLLGICLGLQLLFEGSDEGQAAGLGLVAGRVRSLPRSPGHPVPHMGWAPLVPAAPTPLLPEGTAPAWVYFVHSYAAEPSDTAAVAARVRFGAVEVTAAIWQGSIAACQFHPEKSSLDGQALLRRWLDWVEARDEGRP